MLLHKIVKQISDEHFRVRFSYSSSQLYKKFIAPIDKMELMSIIASLVRTTAAHKNAAATNATARDGKKIGA